jgi:hypothetical protein
MIGYEFDWYKFCFYADPDVDLDVDLDVDSDLTFNLDADLDPAYGTPDLFTQGRGRGWTSEKVRGVEYHYDWLYLHSVNSMKH